MMRYGLIACLTFSAALAQEPAATLTIAKDGKSSFRIVIARTATAQEKHATEELRDLLRLVTGATLPIATDDQAVAEHEIMIGRNRHLDLVRARVDFDQLGTEGFTIRTVGPHLVIAGATPRANRYAVYTFLEDHIGCRWYTSAVSFVPTKSELVLGKIDQTQVPAMVYREVYYAEAREHAFALHQKLNAGFEQAEPGEFAQDVISGNGWAHTLFSFLPPDKYFAEHPDYFALRDGKRQPTQPCLASADVLRIVVENLKTAVQANPQFKYWSVSQMDNGEPCACPQCKAIDDREGSPSGAMIEFVNKVAERFPDKIISTLAYWYTMGPPKTVKPARNVHIMFCIDADRTPPFPAWLEGWSKIAPRMYIWYYVIPCHNFIAPWPNLRLLQPQIQDYVAHGASGMFNEGGYNAGSEFAELRSFLLAKLMWNPECDVSALIDDFLQGYYGAAGPAIRKYIDVVHDSLAATGGVLNGHYWSAHFAGGFLAPAMLARYDAQFDEAEQAVADKPELLLRVQHARMPLMHAELQLHYGAVAARLALVDKLRDYAVRSHTDFFADFNERPTEAYLAGVRNELLKEQQEQAAKP